MKHIDTPNAVDGRFKDKTSNFPGTEINASYMNALQDEICNVITDSGLSLNSTEFNQMSQAIDKRLDTGFTEINKHFSEIIKVSDSKILQLSSNNKIYNASDYITDFKHSSAEMNELIKKVQANGGGTIYIDNREYCINSVIPASSDTDYSTGWLVPYTSDQGQENKQGVTFEISAGANLVGIDDNMIMIRGSNNFTRIIGSGKSVANGKNTIHVAFAPEDLNQNTTKVSQQFCSVDKNMSYSGGHCVVLFQSGPTIDGQTSGSYYHTVGFQFYNVNYPVWFKAPEPNTVDNLTTTTFLEHIYGHQCISSGKFEACDIHITNCAFEGMSGEMIEYYAKASEGMHWNNTVKIDNCDYEAYDRCTVLDEWGITIGQNVKIAGKTIVKKEAKTPQFQLDKQIYGSYGVVDLQSHTVEHRIGLEHHSIKQMAHIMNTDAYIMYSETSDFQINLPTNKVEFNTAGVDINSQVNVNKALYTNSGCTRFDPAGWVSSFATDQGTKTGAVGIFTDVSLSDKRQSGVAVIKQNKPTVSNKEFYPFIYQLPGDISLFNVDIDGNINGGDITSKHPDKFGLKVSGTPKFISIAPISIDGTISNTMDLRNYGNDDWRVGETNKILTTGNTNLIKTINGVAPDSSGNIDVLNKELSASLAEAIKRIEVLEAKMKPSV